jgi:Cu+-exporting ATPase
MNDRQRHYHVRVQTISDGAMPSHSPEPAAMEQDPVRGMTVDPAKALSADYDGRRYYFCCSGCRDKFLADPQIYLTDQKPLRATEQRLGFYTCPMHPELHQAHPGVCPKCGMALSRFGYSLFWLLQH